VFFWAARLAVSPLCGESGFMRAVHPGMIVIMRTSLHQRASNTSARVEHLLWAMDAGKDRDFRASNRGPLSIMMSARARNSRPWRRVVAFSSGIEARPAGNLHRPEKEISGEPNIRTGEQF
jgi:hypothetical protein